MIGLIIILLVLGAIMGFLARAILPGEQKMSILWTIIIGAIGSYLGAGVAHLLNFDVSYIISPENKINFTALIAALIGSIIVLIIWCLIFKKKWR